MSTTTERGLLDRVVSRWLYRPTLASHTGDSASRVIRNYTTSSKQYDLADHAVL